MRETKHKTALDSFQLTAQLVQFNESSNSLMAPIVEALVKSEDVETTAKLESVLEHLAAGIRTNPTATTKDLLIFTYRLISENLDTLRDTSAVEEEEEQKDDWRARRKARAKEKKNQRFDPKRRKFEIEPDPRQHRRVLQSATTATEGSRYVLVDFALNILHSVLKTGKVSPTKNSHLQMLDPFVRLVLRCIGSKYDTVLMNGMKSTCQVLKFPLPSIADKAPKIASRTVYIMLVR